MSRIVRCGLIQARNVLGAECSLGEIREAMVRKHVEMIEEAAREKVQILCLQELFYGPYFCAEQDPRWYELAEAVPDGPSVRLMQELAAKHHMVIIVPVYEQELPGLYFNTAAVIDEDGRYLDGGAFGVDQNALGERNGVRRAADARELAADLGAGASSYRRITNCVSASKSL